jgi:hypothetical protein
MGIALHFYLLYAVCLAIQTRGVILYSLRHISLSSDMMLIIARIRAVYFLCADTFPWGCLEAGTQKKSKALFLTGHGGPYGCET